MHYQREKLGRAVGGPSLRPRLPPGTACSVAGCGRTGKLSRGKCSMHYQRERHGLPPEGGRKRRCGKLLPGAACTVRGCDRPERSAGMCNAHRNRHNRFGDPLRGGALRTYPKYESDACSVASCKQPRDALGLCKTHYQRKRQTGKVRPNDPIKTYPGRSKQHGYWRVRAPGHPNAGKDGSILEHRLVMSTHLSRALIEHESVHHVNGDRGDNRLSNLELWSTSQPCGQRVADKLRWAREMISLYGTEA